MKIDKTRFLALTSGLAAATAALIACSSTTTKTDNPSTPTNDSGVTTDSGDSTDSGGQSDSGSDAAACLSDKGAAPFCVATGEGLDGGADADTDGGDAAAPMESACPEQCTQAKNYFKSDVAADVDTCLGNATSSCDGTTLADCIDQALAKTCDDPTAATFCADVMTACGDDAGDGGAFTEAECETVAKGLNADGRTQFLGCVQEGVSSCTDCVAALKTVPTL